MGKTLPFCIGCVCALLYGPARCRRSKAVVCRQVADEKRKGERAHHLAGQEAMTPAFRKLACLCLSLSLSLSLTHTHTLIARMVYQPLYSQDSCLFQRSALPWRWQGWLSWCWKNSYGPANSRPHSSTTASRARTPPFLFVQCPKLQKG